jgi:hypothetical protein
MNTTEKEESERREYPSPIGITLLVVNAICFGGFVALLAVGARGVPVVLLTIGTGMSLSVGLTRTLKALHTFATRRPA